MKNKLLKNNPVYLLNERRKLDNVCNNNIPLACGPFSYELKKKNGRLYIDGTIDRNPDKKNSFILF